MGQQGYTNTSKQPQHLTFLQEMIIFRNAGVGKQSNLFIEAENIKVTTYTENLHKKNLLSTLLSFPSSGKTEESEPSNRQTSHQPLQTSEVHIERRDRYMTIMTNRGKDTLLLGEEDKTDTQRKFQT